LYTANADCIVVVVVLVIVVVAISICVLNKYYSKDHAYSSNSEPTSENSTPVPLNTPYKFDPISAEIEMRNAEVIGAAFNPQGGTVITTKIGTPMNEIPLPLVTYYDEDEAKVHNFRPIINNESEDVDVGLKRINQLYTEEYMMEKTKQHFRDSHVL
jgi:hypothetical protein